MIERSRESIIIESIKGKAKLTHAWDLKLGGFYRLIGPSVAGSFEQQAGAQVNSIRRIRNLEAESPSGVGAERPRSSHSGAHGFRVALVRGRLAYDRGHEVELDFARGRVRRH
jgi:hypothetical protein